MFGLLAALVYLLEEYVDLLRHCRLEVAHRPVGDGRANQLAPRAVNAFVQGIEDTDLAGRA